MGTEIHAIGAFLLFGRFTVPFLPCSSLVTPCQTQQLTRLYRPELVHVKGIFESNIEIGDVESSMTEQIKEYEWNGATWRGEGGMSILSLFFGTHCAFFLPTQTRSSSSSAGGPRRPTRIKFFFNANFFMFHIDSGFFL